MNNTQKVDTREYFRRFKTGIDINEVKQQLQQLLPEINRIGWYESPQQLQFSLQAHPEDFKRPDFNIYHSGCGPTPSLSVEREDNTRIESDYNTITPLFKGTIFEEIINSAPFPYYRTRIFMLRPKGCFRIHKDMYYKFHLPIITGPGCMWVFPDTSRSQSIHCPATGDNYYIDTRVPHTAINGEGFDRYHLCMTSDLPVDKLFSLIEPFEVPLDNNNYPALQNVKLNEYVWSI